MDGSERDREKAVYFFYFGFSFFYFSIFSFVVKVLSYERKRLSETISLSVRTFYRESFFVF